MKPGNAMELKLGRINDIQDAWVFISPWDGWIIVPEPGGYCKTVLARRGDREALVSSDGTRAMTASILAAINKQTALDQTLSEQQRKVIFEKQAERFGLSPEEVDKAIRAWKDRSQDPFDVGIAALYERNYLQATARLTKSLKLREKEKAESREQVAEASYFLGQSLYEQGRYSEASENYRKATKLRPGDSAILETFAVSLVNAAAYSEAKPILERSLVKRERILGKEHPDTATSLNNLGALLKAMGDYPAARRYYEEALEINKKVIGEEHPDTVVNLNNLAILCYHENNFQEAANLMRKSLAIVRKVFGENHPNTKSSMKSLAEIEKRLD